MCVTSYVVIVLFTVKCQIVYHCIYRRALLNDGDTF